MNRYGLQLYILMVYFDYNYDFCVYFIVGNGICSCGNCECWDGWNGNVCEIWFGIEYF